MSLLSKNSSAVLKDDYLEELNCYCFCLRQKYFTFYFYILLFVSHFELFKKCCMTSLSLITVCFVNANLIVLSLCGRCEIEKSRGEGV